MPAPVSEAGGLGGAEIRASDTHQVLLFLAREPHWERAWMACPVPTPLTTETPGEGGVTLDDYLHG